MKTKFNKAYIVSFLLACPLFVYAIHGALVGELGVPWSLNSGAATVYGARVYGLAVHYGVLALLITLTPSVLGKGRSIFRQPDTNEEASEENQAEKSRVQPAVLLFYLIFGVAVIALFVSANMPGFMLDEENAEEVSTVITAYKSREDGTQSDWKITYDLAGIIAPGPVGHVRQSIYLGVDQDDTVWKVRSREEVIGTKEGPDGRLKVLKDITQITWPGTDKTLEIITQTLMDELGRIVERTEQSPGIDTVTCTQTDPGDAMPMKAEVGVKGVGVTLSCDDGNTIEMTWELRVFNRWHVEFMIAETHYPKEDPGSATQYASYYRIDSGDEVSRIVGEARTDKQWVTLYGAPIRGYQLQRNQYGKVIK